MYYSLEIPADLDRVVPATDEVADMLEALVSAWDLEVERARATEAEVEAVSSSRVGPGHPEAQLEIEALRRSHRALVATLERSIADLEALQERTVGIVRLVADAVRDVEDQTGMCLTASGPTEFPSSEETDVIDRTNRRDLAHLDVPSRWRPVKRRRTISRAAAGTA